MVTHIGGIANAWWVCRGLAKMCCVLKKKRKKEAKVKTVEKAMQLLCKWTATKQEVNYPWRILSTGWTWVLSGWDLAILGPLFPYTYCKRLNSACVVPTDALLKEVRLVWNASFRRSSMWEKESWQCNVPQREHTPGYSEHNGEQHEVNSISWSMAAINP